MLKEADVGWRRYWWVAMVEGGGAVGSNGGLSSSQYKATELALAFLQTQSLS